MHTFLSNLHNMDSDCWCMHAQKIDVSKEDPDQTADRLVQFLKMVKYKPPASLDPWVLLASHMAVPCSSAEVLGIKQFLLGGGRGLMGPLFYLAGLHFECSWPRATETLFSRCSSGWFHSPRSSRSGRSSVTTSASRM